MFLKVTNILAYILMLYGFLSALREIYELFLIHIKRRKPPDDIKWDFKPVYSLVKIKTKRIAEHHKEGDEQESLRVSLTLGAAYLVSVTTRRSKSIYINKVCKYYKHEEIIGKFRLEQSKACVRFFKEIAKAQYSFKHKRFLFFRRLHKFLVQFDSCIWIFRKSLYYIQRQNRDQSYCRKTPLSIDQKNLHEHILKEILNRLIKVKENQKNNILRFMFPVVDLLPAFVKAEDVNARKQTPRTDKEKNDGNKQRGKSDSDIFLDELHAALIEGLRHLRNKEKVLHNFMDFSQIDGFNIGGIPWLCLILGKRNVVDGSVCLSNTIVELLNIANDQDKKDSLDAERLAIRIISEFIGYTESMKNSWTNGYLAIINQVCSGIRASTQAMTLSCRNEILDALEKYENSGHDLQKNFRIPIHDKKISQLRTNGKILNPEMLITNLSLTGCQVNSENKPLMLKKGERMIATINGRDIEMTYVYNHQRKNGEYSEGFKFPNPIGVELLEEITA